jgi:hypothetical protein
LPAARANKGSRTQHPLSEEILLKRERERERERIKKRECEMSHLLERLGEEITGNSVPGGNVEKPQQGAESGKRFA